jgi:hypothetical protein
VTAEQLARDVEPYLVAPAPATAAPAAAPAAGESAPLRRMAPDFVLPRENGELVRLSDFLDKHSVVMVFYRGQT